MMMIDVMMKIFSGSNNTHTQNVITPYIGVFGYSYLDI